MRRNGQASLFIVTVSRRGAPGGAVAGGENAMCLSLPEKVSRNKANGKGDVHQQSPRPVLQREEQPGYEEDSHPGSNE